MPRGAVLLTILAVAIPGPWAGAEQEEPGPVAQAKAREAAGDVDGAIELLEDAATAAASGEIFLKLGVLRADRNELDLAMDAFATAAERLEGPLRAEALARLALAQELRGMIVEAEASTEGALAADPAGVYPTIARARSVARGGDAVEAVALAGKAVARGGGVDAAAALGFAHEAEGNLAAAEQTYREALADAGGDVGLTVGLARVLRRSSRAADAEPLLQQALAASPGAVPAYKEDARVKIALGRPMEAMGSAATAAALAPEDPEAQALQKEAKVAIALSYLDDPAQAGLAIPDLESLIAEEPELVLAHVGLARAHIAQHQPTEAQAALDKALALDPEDPEALYYQGHLRLALLGDFAGAVEPLAQAVAADPSNLTYRSEYGLALKQVQRYPEAIEELTKVVESPGYNRADAWIFLGEAQVGAQHYEAAIEALNRASGIAGEVARVEAMLGWAYFGLKDAESFTKHAGKARELGYEEATLLDYLKRVEGGEPIK